MKRFFVSAAVAVLGAGMALAQNFTVKINDQEMTDGSTVRVEQVVDPNDWNTVMLPAHLAITNNTDAELTVTSSLSPVTELADGAFFSDCTMGSCMPGFDGKTISIPGGTTLSDDAGIAWVYDYTPATGDYSPWSLNITYTDNTGYSITCTIEFVPLQPSANESLNSVAIAAYPNPASDEVTFSLGNVKAGSKLVLRDMSGRTVKMLDAEAEVSMDLEGLSSGVYFYSLEENGKAVVTRKLVVR